MKPWIFILVGILWLAFGVMVWTGHAHLPERKWGPVAHDPKTIAKVFFGCGAIFIALGGWGLRPNPDR